MALEVCRDGSFAFVPPPSTHTGANTHSFVLVFPSPNGVYGREKENRMNLRTDIMWMFCVMLGGDVRAGQATPPLLGLLSASPASWVSDAKPRRYGGIFFQIFRADSQMQAWLILQQRTSDYYMGLVRNSNKIT